MTTPAVTPNEVPLSQVSRVVNTFVSPSKTFRDINRSASWWLPFVIIAIVSLVFIAVIDVKIGFAQVTENQMRMNPRGAERIEQAPPEQRERIMGMQVKATKIFSYGSPAFILLFYVIVAAILLGSYNLGAGAQVRFGQALAIVVFANLVGIVKALLGIVTIVAGASPEGFMIQNPVATNLGYFLNPVEHKVLFALGTSCDVITFWTLILVAMGFTCISKVKKGTSYAIVFGWWAVLTLIQVAIAAIF